MKVWSVEDSFGGLEEGTFGNQSQQVPHHDFGSIIADVDGYRHISVDVQTWMDTDRSAMTSPFYCAVGSGPVVTGCDQQDDMSFVFHLQFVFVTLII